MRKVARMLRAHEELILNWFRAKGEISAGTVEGLNNKIRVVTRRSYGFRTYEVADRYVFVAVVPLVLVLLAISFWHVYRGAFPSLKGGQGSLVYFREIANQTESQFIHEFTNQSDEEYSKDSLGQVWRNSEILREKFDHLSSAFNWLALAILACRGCVVFFAVHYPSK